MGNFTDQWVVYADVDISYGSSGYGDFLVYNPELRPVGIRKVTYVNRINGAKLKEMMKQAMWEPPTC